MNKKSNLIFLLFAWSILIPVEARACTCVEYDVPVCAAYWRADAVFAGQLLDITPVEKKSDAELPTVMLHFTVEQPFRGVAGNRVDVETLYGTSCDMKFKKGERYLIYASRDEDSNQLFAGPCTRTTTLKNADVDLEYIRMVTQGEAPQSILGRLLLQKWDPISGAKVIVRGGDKTLETTTDGNGNYAIVVSGSGKYTVQAFIPFSAVVMAYAEDENGKLLETTDALTTFEYEVDVEKNECHYRQIDTFKIDLHATAEISGNVLTASGRAVFPGLINLVNAADPNRGDFKRLDENGLFKFKGLPAGEYYLVLNPRNEAPDEHDAPYPPTYYPGVPEASAATKIVVGEGAKLENLTLRVGPAWKERVVSGKVVWQDGRLPKNCSVSLYNGHHYVRRIKTDEKARFEFKVYGDFQYTISAEGWGKTRGLSERVPIPTEKSTGLRLVLRRAE